MEAGIARDEAFALLKEHNEEAFHIEHAGTLEQTMLQTDDSSQNTDPFSQFSCGVSGSPQAKIYEPISQ